MTDKTKDAAAQRAKALDDWLEKHGARRLWTLEQPRFHRFTVACYDVGNAVALVQRWDDGGWEIFVPASLENNVEAAFRGAERALEITS